MKIKKLICIVMTAVMLASLCTIAVSAESVLSISQDYSGNKSYKEINSKTKAELVGAVMAHQMMLDGDAVGNGIGYLTGGGYFSWDEIPEEKEKGTRLDDPKTLEGKDLSYVAYKVTASDGNCIDTLVLDLKYILAGSKPDDGQFLQLGVYVLDRIDFANKNGKIDFSDKTAAKILGGGYDYDGNHMTQPLQIDLSGSVDVIGERKSLYVVIVSYSNSSLMGVDNGRFSGQATQWNRICGVEINATETAATSDVTEPDDSLNKTEEETQGTTAPAASDKPADTTAADTAGDGADNGEKDGGFPIIPVIIGVIAVAAIAGVVVVISKKSKKH